MKMDKIGIARRVNALSVIVRGLLLFLEDLRRLVNGGYQEEKDLM